MNPIRLISEIIIDGPDFFGRKAKIIFSPLERGLHQWWWGSVLIVPEIVWSEARRLRLGHYYFERRLETYEHIGVLRWFGLCDLQIESTPWPPHYGRSLEFWQALKPHCIEDTSREINWFTIKDRVRWVYPKKRAGLTCFTEIWPSREKKLKLEVRCSFRGLGDKVIRLNFPDNQLLEKIISVPTQGWPPGLYYISKTASSFRIWPHHNKVVWPQSSNKEEILEKFALHRAADLLGALSLLCGDGLLSAQVISECSGHKADLETVLLTNKLLYRLE